MIEINVHKPIGYENENWVTAFGHEQVVFSLDVVQKIFADNKNESDFKFNIHCDGGVVSEGLAIYDFLRTSGKNIHMNIEGNCHSMAVTLLLAAPFENRTANPNCRALIHKVYGYDFFASADELRERAEEIEREQNAILDIYAERTGKNREDLEALLKEEKVRTASELLQYGFISKINKYNTNLFTKKMSKNEKSNFIQKLNKVVNAAKNLLEGIVNYEFTTEDGTLLFTTDKEDDTIAVGDTATPDGVYELQDGRSVTISEGVIAEIVEPTSDNTELENLRAENEALRNSITELTNTLVEARNQIVSNFKPAARVANVGKNTQKTSEDIINEAKEKRKKFIEGGK